MGVGWVGGWVGRCMLGGGCVIVGGGCVVVVGG